jgi:multidrug efflux system outer membrane protein
MRKIYLFLGLALLEGCAFREIKDIDNAMYLPENKSFTVYRDSNTSNSTIPSFKNLFPYEELESLIRTGLEKSPNWRAKLAKLELVKTSSGLSIAESKPSLSTKLGWTAGSEKTRESNFQKSDIPNLQSAALFNWELDLWGKWKMIKESSIMHIEEATYLNNASRISFIHDIAEVWFLLAAQQEQLQILQTAISSQEKTIRFYQQRLDAGLDDNITYMRQSVVLDQLNLERAVVLREREVSKIKLSSLIGNPLEEALPKIPILSQIDLPELPEIFPTNALQERPDIKAKEAKLRESMFMEKSAEYDLFPSLGFQMSGISMTSNASEPFEQWKASFGPVFNFPIWSPKKKILLATAKAESELRKKEWKAIIFQAIEEIESSTRSFMMGNNEYGIAKKSSLATKSILDTSKEKFRAGLVSELQLLEDERQFLKTNIREIESRLQIFQFALNLSKSLGLSLPEI